MHLIFKLVLDYWFYNKNNRPDVHANVRSTSSAAIYMWIVKQRRPIKYDLQFYNIDYNACTHNHLYYLLLLLLIDISVHAYNLAYGVIAQNTNSLKCVVDGIRTNDEVIIDKPRGTYFMHQIPVNRDCHIEINQRSTFTEYTNRDLFANNIHICPSLWFSLF